MEEDILKTKEELISEVQLLKERIHLLEETYVVYRKKMDAEVLQAKEQEQWAIKSNSVLMSNMSHDIRVPMNGIIGMIDVLLQTELTEEQKEYVQIISNSSENLLTIINDILDLSKVQTGLISFNNEPININEQINEVIEKLLPNAKGKGIFLVYNTNILLKKLLIADPHRFKQILFQLTNNAIKFTKEGGVTIEVAIVSINENECTIKVFVNDTGMGLTNENKIKINKAFSLSGPILDFEDGGIGLGLAICKNLIRLQNGNIGFESEYQHGASFWFELTFGISEVEKDEDSVSEALKSTDYPSLTILLVEDNLLNQKFASAALKKAGHFVDIAENGKIALEKYLNKKYDLILMDVQMPIMDGIEATLKIREYEQVNNIQNRIKIVAITAFAMERDRERCLTAGMDDFLSKPFKPKDLLSIINDLIK